ncbi:MAG TPA: hypothetical protein VFZ18_13475 [Longimicrobiaceae bacterium]
MIITQLSATPGGTAGPLQGQEITPPIGSPPLRIFRRTLHFRIPTGGAAEALEIDPEATLRASFAALDYDALDADEPALRATVGSLAGGVVVTLDAPRRVLRVTLPKAVAPTASRLEFYRLDGDTPSGEPTVTAVREQVKSVVDKQATGFRGARGGRASRAATSAGDQFLDHDAADHIAVQSTSRFNVEFTDARFLLRLTTSAGASLPLSPSNLQSVTIRGYPTNPRIGLAFPPDAATAADPGAASFFWRADGEVGTTTPAEAGTVDAGPELATELDRAASRLSGALADAAPEGAAPLLPAHLDVALVLESDAPCVLRPPTSGAAFRLEIRRVRESFADGAPKRVLRFDPGSTSAEISLDLPGGVTLASAEIGLDVSVSADRSSTGGGAGAGGGGGDGTGVRGTTERRVAQRIQLEQATSVSGIAVAVMPLTADAEAALELRADAAGAPDGGVLAAGPVTLDRPGRAGWSVVGLPAAVVVSTAPHWLVLSVRAGAVVWMAHANGGGVRVLPGHGPAASGSSEIAGVSTLYDLRTRAGAAAEAAPPLEISSGGQPVELVAEEDGRFSADLRAAVQPAVTAGAAGSTVSIPIRFATVDRGVVTVYPPRVVYD